MHTLESGLKYIRMAIVKGNSVYVEHDGIRLDIDNGVPLCSIRIWTNEVKVVFHKNITGDTAVVTIKREVDENGTLLNFDYIWGKLLKLFRIACASYISSYTAGLAVIDSIDTLDTLE